MGNGGGIKHEWEPNLHLVPIPGSSYRSRYIPPSYCYCDRNSVPEYRVSFSLSDESVNLHAPIPENADDAQLLTTFTAFSGILRVPSESPGVPFTAHLVFKPTVRSWDRGNSFNTCLAVHVTHIHAPGRPGANEVNHLKN